MRWEYKRVRFDMSEVGKPEFETQLALLGEAGWELTVALHHEHHGYSREVHLVFKRSTEPRT